MGNSNQYKIHPIVMGTKAFDKGMMTYQHDYGKLYIIPIYCWYLEGRDKKILVDTGELAPLQSKERENAIGGKIYKFEEGLSRWGLKPEDRKTSILSYTPIYITTTVKMMTNVKMQYSMCTKKN